ncbi:hypothetical protein HOLleu_37879 [Holothuria leucospilota]|uniref:Uncharacterized protein n=1 Tax=Holothuria leucospilota TaxID=206669 RepID=A0A9Q1BF30_HOLLE|nr:hypothetical protein HOLleu_37879 [Holothuria leucospilota]
MESSREFNFNAAFLHRDHRLALSLFARGTSSYATAGLQVYYCTIVNVHALPALGPDQANIK